MAKRIYKEKVLSPEMARENALKGAKCDVLYDRKRAAMAAEAYEKLATTRGRFGDATDEEIADLRRCAKSAADQLSQSEAHLAALLVE